MLSFFTHVGLAYLAALGIAGVAATGCKATSRTARVRSSQIFKVSGDITNSTQFEPSRLAAGDPIGVYQSLLWKNFNLLTPLNIASVGLQCHSGANCAYIDSSVAQGSALMSVIYPNTASSSFRLQEIYFGCTQANVPKTPSIMPVPCDMTLTAYSGSVNQPSNSKKICSLSFPYTPTVGSQSLALAQLRDTCIDRSNNVQFITVKYAVPKDYPVPGPYALVVDDATYLTCPRV